MSGEHTMVTDADAAALAAAVLAALPERAMSLRVRQRLIDAGLIEALGLDAAQLDAAPDRERIRLDVVVAALDGVLSQVAGGDAKPLRRPRSEAEADFVDTLRAHSLFALALQWLRLRLSGRTRGTDG